MKFRSLGDLHLGTPGCLAESRLAGTEWAGCIAVSQQSDVLRVNDPKLLVQSMFHRVLIGKGGIIENGHSSGDPAVWCGL